ncbi:MAG TPA: hypothetical protein VNA14_03905 [Mycobacteriales bacterium]|nr:hypothetical protein [Mycobacteriales bacterium]
MTTAEVLTSDVDGPRRSVRDWPGPAGTPVVVVLAVTIALLLTTGLTAVVRLSGGGPQPEDALPGSTFAFAKVDLDPAASQKLAVRALARRFDSAPGESLLELRDAVLRAAVEPLGLDYDDDVAPWLGNRYAVAGFVVGDDAHPLVAVQVDDAAAARRAIDRADGDDVGVAFVRGYALIAESSDLAEEAARQATASPLTDDTEFTEDIARLTGDQIVSGWADHGEIYDRFFVDVVTAMEMDAAAHDPRASFGGRSVFGIHATRRYVEVESFVVGTRAPADGAGPALLTSLPADTVAAVAVTNPAAVQSSTAAVGAFGSLGSAGLVALGVGGVGGVGRTPSTDSIDAVLDALAPVADELEAQLLPLLRSGAALALGPLPGGASSRSDASLLLVAEVAAPGNAQVPLLHARDALRRSGLTSEIAIRGRLVHAAVGSAYVGNVGEPGDLGKSDLFGEAMGQLDPATTAAVYVDVAAISRTQPAFPLDARAVQAIGASSYPTATGSAFRLRIVIG